MFWNRFQNQPDVACKRGLLIVFEPIPELLEVACKRGLIIIFEPILESTGCSLLARLNYCFGTDSRINRMQLVSEA